MAADLASTEQHWPKSPSAGVALGKPAALRTTTAIWLWPVAIYLVGALVFFRWQIFSNFDLLFGDRGDARLVSFLHEHVYRWLFERSGLLSPPFFFDQLDTLGYSDAFLLNQAIYAPVRLLGADPLLALSMVAVVLSAVSYAFIYLFLRRLDVAVPLAALAALIGTFPNNLFIKSGHLQHFALYYIPVVAYSALVAILELNKRPVRAFLFCTIGAALYGFVFSTGYYVAWFFGLALIIFLPITLVVAWPGVRNWLRQHPRRALGLAVVAALSFCASITIFIIIYAPVLATGATRTIPGYLRYAPELNDVINVGKANLFWSGPIRALGLIADDRLAFGEVSIALTPLVQVLLTVASIFALRPQFWPQTDAGMARAFVLASAAIFVMFFVLSIKVHNHTLFQILYWTVPGATAIRVGYRSMVVANLFAACAIALSFDRLFRLSLQQPGMLFRRGVIVWSDGSVCACRSRTDQSRPSGPSCRANSNVSTWHLSASRLRTAGRSTRRPRWAAPRLKCRSTP